MRQRATSFLHGHFLPLLFDKSEQEMNVAVVAHGLILRVLWSCLVELFDPMHVSIAPGIALRDGEPASLISPIWSNTGYMALSIQSSPPSRPSIQQQPSYHNTPATADSAMKTAQDPTPTQVISTPDALPLLHGWSMTVLTIDGKEHLSGLRRTRGGIGSATHDARQKRIDHFFK